jgi:hypothetical protein
MNKEDEVAFEKFSVEVNREQDPYTLMEKAFIAGMKRGRAAPAATLEREQELSTIFGYTRFIISNRTGIPEDSIDLTTSFNFLKMDAIDKIEIMCDIECGIGMQLTLDEDADQVCVMETIGSAVSLLEKRLAERNKLKAATAPS